jgi:hypothetical protein
MECSTGTKHIEHIRRVGHVRLRAVRVEHDSTHKHRLNRLRWTVPTRNLRTESDATGKYGNTSWRWKHFSLTHPIRTIGNY